MNSVIDLAKTALAQSKSLESLAEAGKWEELAELQKAQAAIVEEIMLTEVEESIKAELRALLLEIKNTNNQTMDLAGIVKQDLIKEKQKLKQASKMQKALDALK